MRTLSSAPGYGAYAAWEYSTDLSGGGFPDLNARCNFYDYSTGEWNWIDPDYLHSGVNVFTQRAAFGLLAVDHNTDCAHVSGHYASQTGIGGERPKSARMKVQLWPSTIVRHSLILTSDFDLLGCGRVQ